MDNHTVDTGPYCADQHLSQRSRTTILKGLLQARLAVDRLLAVKSEFDVMLKVAKKHFAVSAIIPELRGPKMAGASRCLDAKKTATTVGPQSTLTARSPDIAGYSGTVCRYFGSESETSRGRRERVRGAACGPTHAPLIGFGFAEAAVFERRPADPCGWLSAFGRPASENLLRKRTFSAGAASPAQLRRFASQAIAGNLPGLPAPC